MGTSSTQWPTFLGIGVPKAGTTWLYEVLDSHPQIWVPEHEREVHFFNRYYEDRGLDWYGKFFPGQEHSPYEAVGEVTPHYFYCEEERIADIKSTIPSIQKFILILRNPIDRLYSHYWFRRRVENAEESFRSFIGDRSIVVEWSRYARFIQRWLEHYDRSQVLVLTTEKDLGAAEESRRKIAEFLQVDPCLFPDDSGNSKKNPRHLPRYKLAYRWAISVRRILEKADIQWPKRIARALGVKHWFGKKTIDRKMDLKIREELTQFYADDVEKLEQLLGREFSEWKDFDSFSGH